MIWLHRKYQETVDSLWDLTSGTTEGPGLDASVSSSQIVLASLFAFSMLSNGGGVYLGGTPLLSSLSSYAYYLTHSTKFSTIG